MGNRTGALMKRLFDYPIKRKPICFFRQEDFTSTGEPIQKEEKEVKGPMTEYDKLVQAFYMRLLSQRKINKQMQEKNRRWSLQRIIQRFPGWNELTISNLHSMFLLFDNNMNGMLALEDFCAILESMGDESPIENRKAKFEKADINMDGWITYDEFLALVYNYDPPIDGNITGLAKMCYEAAENIKFVSGLSVGEQLEYGLF